MDSPEQIFLAGTGEPAPGLSSAPFSYLELVSQLLDSPDYFFLPGTGEPAPGLS
jgi:hypothetical protein